MQEPPVNHTAVRAHPGLPSAVPATTVFMLLSATAEWQALPRDERDALLDDVFVRVFNACPGVRLRQYDSSVFDRELGAVLVWEVHDPCDYRDAVSLLNEHALLRHPYLRVANAIVAAEHTGH